MTDRERLLDELRPVAFQIAYRMLGSVSEAEDIVQEALLRLHRALETGEQIQSPRAFVATVTTRLAINELHSARARRERYVGEWLPEPIITDGHDDPARHAETADSLSLAVLVLLESLSPEQRAVLLLHDVFDYEYPEIATILGKTQDNVRQLATRARRHVEQRRPRFQTTREERDELAQRFFRGRRAGRPRRARGAARRGRAADRRRRRQGSGARTVTARAQPCCAHADQLAPPRRAPSGRVVAPRRGQWQPGRAVSRRAAAADRRAGARYRRRSDHQHRRDRQPRQAHAPRASRRPQTATEVGTMNSGSATSPPCIPARGGLFADLLTAYGNGSSERASWTSPARALVVCPRSIEVRRVPGNAQKVGVRWATSRRPARSGAWSSRDPSRGRWVKRLRSAGDREKA